ncbi:MAG: hypothetical protein HYR84_08140 [Planctomycetes bacterium]|nr:hypothetical protein [Planctomycetota bacterium]
MFQLHDLKKSKVWREAHEEGRKEGREEGREEGKELGQAEFVRKLLAKGKSAKEIAAVLDMAVADVRRLAKRKG